MLSKEDKLKLIKKYGSNEKDSGNAGVQIAILTNEINLLNKHLEIHPKDKHTKRGLLQKIGKRRYLSNYYLRKNKEAYAKLIKSLGLRK